MFQYYNWEEVVILWDKLDMTWEEVGIFINDILPHVKVSSPGLNGTKYKIDLKKINKLPEEKRRKIIHIALKIEDKKFEDYKYSNKDLIKVKAKDIKIIMNKVLSTIKVNVKNIS